MTTSPSRSAVGELVLPLSVNVHGAGSRLVARVAAHLRRTWLERADEDGLDEAVTKMIWLAVGITVAVAATTFFITVFNSAKDAVPDPVAPTP